MHPPASPYMPRGILAIFTRAELSKPWPKGNLTPEQGAREGVAPRINLLGQPI